MSYELIRYAWIDEDNELYVSVIEDYSDDTGALRAYQFTYRITNIREAYRPEFKHEPIDHFIEDGGTEDMILSSNDAIQSRLSSITQLNDARHCLILDDANDSLSVSELVANIMARLKKTDPSLNENTSQQEASGGF